MFKLGGKPNSDGVGITSGLNRPGYKNSNYKEFQKASRDSLKGMENMGKIGTPEMMMMLSNVLGQGGSIYDMITNAQTEVMPKYADYKKIQSKIPGAKAAIYGGLTEVDFAKEGLDIKREGLDIQRNKETATKTRQKAGEANIEMISTDYNGSVTDLITQANSGDPKAMKDYATYKLNERISNDRYMDDATVRANALKFVQDVYKDEKEILMMTLKDEESDAYKLLIEVEKYIRGLAGGNAMGGVPADRRGYAMGMGPAMGQQTQAIDIQTPGMNEEIVDTQTEFSTTNKPTGQDPFTLLRARLPKEITDDVVKLIAYNPEAFKDFASIENQQDVINFNQTYGVELVIPTAQE
jgi:hypothetical protein